jgi:hypothetical protein
LEGAQFLAEHIKGLGPDDAALFFQDERGRCVHAQAGRFPPHVLERRTVFPRSQGLLQGTGIEARVLPCPLQNLHVPDVLGPGKIRGKHGTVVLIEPVMLFCEFTCFEGQARIGNMGDI